MTAPLHNYATKQKVMEEMKRAYDTSDLFGAPCTGSRRVYYSETINRWLIVNGRGEITEDANGYGYKTKESALKAARYFDREVIQKLHEINRGSRRRGSDLETDMELAQSYYGYDSWDFC